MVWFAKAICNYYALFAELSIPLQMGMQKPGIAPAGAAGEAKRRGKPAGIRKPFRLGGRRGAEKISAGPAENARRDRGSCDVSYS